MRKKITRRKRPILPPPVLTPVPREQVEAQGQKDLKEVWMCRRWNWNYTVQIYSLALPDTLAVMNPTFPPERLCITHGGISTADKASKITRDTLMELKLQCRRGGQWALEAYPTLDHGFAVPEARHLYIFYEKPEFL